MEESAEQLLGMDPYYSLTTYWQQALASGNTPEEKKNNLHNALMLVTYWGENNRKEDYLHEYAYKEWSGMMRSFYKKRWEMYFTLLKDQMKGGTPPALDFFGWERSWVSVQEQIVADGKSPGQPAMEVLIATVNNILSRL
jgi:alpha-N-acetylglucosaminidase